MKHFDPLFPTSREVVVTDLPESTTTSKQPSYASLVVATIEQLGINTHTAFTRNMKEEEL